jgi:uncharacterized membrane protein YeaQ/YmgE (transglycosylase-associated protein family)
MVWMGIGVFALTAIARAMREHGRLVRIMLAVVVPGWSLFSCIAAEVTRLYLLVYPFPLFLCAFGLLGFAIVGATTGYLAGWFIGGKGFGIRCDLAAGALGAVIAGCIEVTLSYNHVGYVVAISVIGGGFVAFLFRLLARWYSVRIPNRALYSQMLAVDSEPTRSGLPASLGHRVNYSQSGPQPI